VASVGNDADPSVGVGTSASAGSGDGTSLCAEAVTLDGTTPYLNLWALLALAANALLNMWPVSAPSRLGWTRRSSKCCCCWKERVRNRWVGEKAK